LNSILPPREFTEEKQQLLIQSVSSHAANKSDVINLQKELDRRLIERKARETGICRAREELFSQCFDELIRQITIDHSHRGLLLVRMRDEVRMVIQAYQTLYESALAYGIRKALQGEFKKNQMEARIKELQSECLKFEDEVEMIEEEIKQITQLDKDERSKKRQEHQKIIDEMQQMCDYSKTEMEEILSGEKKKKKLREEAKKLRKKNKEKAKK